MMKKIILCTLFTILSLQIYAQENRRERIKSLKVAFLTEKLNLTSEEAAVFWPAYNEYEDKLFKLKASLGKTLREVAMKDSDAISEQAATETLNRVISLREEIAKTELLFQQNSPNLLGPKKALYLNIYEERFKRELLKKLQERRNGGKRP